jgi:hypothetical protein
VRVIRAGRDAWESINKAQSFEGWKRIGAALAIGKAHALRVTGANRAWGRNYSREFGEWMKRHGLPKSTRSVAIELAENIEAIEQWRSTLPEKQRRRLVHPLSNVRRWRAATAHNGRSPTRPTARCCSRMGALLRLCGGSIAARPKRAIVANGSAAKHQSPGGSLNPGAG